MNLIEFLKDKLTPVIVGKIGNFLGESSENVETALQTALPTMLGGLIHQGTTDTGAKKVLDIIKDGGHTGEILNDLPSLFENFDKTQLLVTIGSNIFNHFFGNTATILTDKIANLSQIRKTSAASLLGLAAPMVLGTIGYVVNKENLGVTGLKNLLEEQRENVNSLLPATIATHLPLRTITTTQQEPSLSSPIITEEKRVEATPKVIKPNQKEESLFGNALPWIILILLALLTAYYLRSCRVKPNETQSSTVITDSLLTEKNGSDLGIIDDSSPINKDIDSPSKGESLSQKEAAEVLIIETPKTSETTNAQPKNTSSTDNSTTSTSSISSQLRSGSWADISSNNFKSGSAEVRNRETINTISSYLKQNPSATILISPAGSGRLAEDRAYAIREQLYQKGIDVSRVSIDPSRGSGNGVSIRVNR